MVFKIPDSTDLRASLAEIDRVRDRFQGGRPAPRARLERMTREARVHGAAAACRLAAIPISDERAAELLDRGARPRDHDERELVRYAEVLRLPPPPRGRLLEVADIGALHATLTGADPTTEMRWRRGPLHNEAFDSTGRATGRVIPTLPAHLVADRTEDLVTWLELELRGGEHHPVSVVATFVLGFLGVSPFRSRNHRIARLLLQKLLLRAGYETLRYASLEAEIERMRDAYYETLDRARTRLWVGEATIDPWIEFVVACLDAQRRRVEAQLGDAADAASPTRRPAAGAVVVDGDDDMSPLQKAILATTREHGVVDAGLLIEKTGANRNTLKDNLRKLVEGGYLHRTGQRRGTRYRIAVSGDGRLPEA